MPTAEEVKKAMLATGQFKEEDLKDITQESIDKLKNAKPVPTGSFAPDAKPAFTIWNGNNFRIVGTRWYWEDTPGSQCGRTRTWYYDVKVGASYRPVANCPQGYSWYEMNLVF